MNDLISELIGLIVILGFFGFIGTIIYFSAKESAREDKKAMESESYRRHLFRKERQSSSLFIVVVIVIVVGIVAYKTEDVRIIASTAIPLSVLGIVAIVLLFLREGKNLNSGDGSGTDSSQLKKLEKRHQEYQEFLKRSWILYTTRKSWKAALFISLALSLASHYDLFTWEREADSVQFAAIGMSFVIGFLIFGPLFASAEYFGTRHGLRSTD